MATDDWLTFIPVLKLTGDQLRPSTYEARNAGAAGCG